MKKHTLTVIALAMLCVCIVGLSAYAVSLNHRAKALHTEVARTQSEIFAGLVSTMHRLNDTLQILSISADTQKTTALLREIHSISAEAAILADHASLTESELRALERFLNTIGDYAHTLAENGTITKNDRSQFLAICSSTEQLVQVLEEARANESVTDAFERIQYPAIVYDGAYTADMQVRPLGLSEYSVTEQHALKLAREFADEALSPAAHTDGDILPFYHFENANKTVHISITKQGGAVLYYKKDVPTDGLSITPTAKKITELERIAEKYLLAHGYGATDMNTIEFDNGTAILEMLPQTDSGILLYPDMITVRIELQSGTVTELNTRAYLLNHHERESPQEILCETDARARLSRELTITQCRRAVIAASDGSERECYEFSCTRDAQKYRVFLNAQTGAEESILLEK